ncbi:unnamed protein product [Adineta ricciae]|uniref:Uncharacterized protein n=3 Tax=Adineta ricciae TaxID=249248 RepID=A0A815KNP2_ADIRI|nr:unnamed protein product [Adineta ricciae]
MSLNANDELDLSHPWLIELHPDDNQEANNAVGNVVQQVERMKIIESHESAHLGVSKSWMEHEKVTGEIINQAAKRAAAETFENICVYHPTQNHKSSRNGSDIRPDFVIAWSCDGARENTAIVDAKDHHGHVPRSEYDKIRRDMKETQATRGILVLGKHASISDKLRDDIEKDNKVDIVHVSDNRDETIRQVSQYIGKIVDPNFVLDDQRWKTYESHVNITEHQKERRLNRHGDSSHYTSDSIYYRFNYPKKQDGTIDERYAANQDRNRDGGPDMRMIHNKTQQAQEQHLNQDGSNDMRNKEHREQLIDVTGHHTNTDGSLDMRFKENKEESSPTSPSIVNNEQNTDNADMRLKVNRANVVDSEGHRQNIDGSPDMRCKENQEDANPSEGYKQINTEIPTKNDGTADMRYTISKEAVASGVITSDENLVQTNESSSVNGNEITSQESFMNDIPTKSDGTADMRYSASQDAVASGDISRDQVLTEGTMGGAGDGPLKADGTPDMRFSANQ